MGSVLLRNVRQAIRDRLVSAVNETLDVSKIAWENRAFDPPNPSPADTTAKPYWIRETFQVASESLPDSQLHHVVGRTVFDVFYPQGKGTEVVEDVCQEIAAAFESKASVSNQGVIVGIDKVVREPGLEADDVWWMASVSIYWRTFSVGTPIQDKF